MSLVLKENEGMAAWMEHEAEEASAAAVAAHRLGWPIMEKMCFNTAVHYREKAAELRAKMAAWAAEDACARGVYVNR